MIKYHTNAWGVKEVPPRERRHREVIGVTLNPRGKNLRETRGGLNKSPSDFLTAPFGNFAQNETTWEIHGKKKW